MAKNNYFASSRWDAGIGNALESVQILNSDLFEDVTGGQVDGAITALVTPVAELALRYYDRRIKAYFRRAGIDLGDDILTVDSIKEKIEAATGLEIVEFSAAGLLIALEKPLARAISELLGFVVTKVFDEAEFKRQVKEHVLARLLDGEGGGILQGQTLHRLRDAATWARAGGAGGRRRILNRAYQRRYRAGHAQTWE